MTENDFSEFNTLLVETGAHLYNKDVSVELIALYWNALRDRCEIVHFKKALAAHITDTSPVGNGRRGDFMPKPADILGQLEIIMSSNRDAGRAWINVESAIRRVGKNNSVAFDDPAVHLAIQALGGWIRLCESLNVDDYMMRKTFMDTYRDLGANPSNPPAYLIGIEDLHNKSLDKNHQIKPIYIDQQIKQALIGNN